MCFPSILLVNLPNIRGHMNKNDCKVSLCNHFYGQRYHQRSPITYVSAYEKLAMRTSWYSCRIYVRSRPTALQAPTITNKKRNCTIIAAAIDNPPPPLPPLLMTSLVPRSTRARPVLELHQHGVPVYLNNINSPGLFHSSDFIVQSPSFVAHAISCKVAHRSSMIFIQDLSMTFKEVCMQFWNMDNSSSKPFFTLLIHVPMEWDMIKLLQSLDASIQSNNCISLINSYTLNGIKLRWNTINTIHHNFI
jgi:hypothetical protein